MEGSSLGSARSLRWGISLRVEVLGKAPLPLLREHLATPAQLLCTRSFILIGKEEGLVFIS